MPLASVTWPSCRFFTSCPSQRLVVVSSFSTWAKVLSFSWSGRHWRRASLALRRESHMSRLFWHHLTIKQTASHARGFKWQREVNLLTMKNYIHMYGKLMQRSYSLEKSLISKANAFIKAQHLFWNMLPWYALLIGVQRITKRTVLIVSRFLSRFSDQQRGNCATLCSVCSHLHRSISKYYH